MWRDNLCSWFTEKAAETNMVVSLLKWIQWKEKRYSKASLLLSQLAAAGFLGVVPVGRTVGGRLGRQD